MAAGTGDEVANADAVGALPALAQGGFLKVPVMLEEA